MSLYQYKDLSQETSTFKYFCFYSWISRIIRVWHLTKMLKVKLMSQKFNIQRIVPVPKNKTVPILLERFLNEFSVLVTTWYYSVYPLIEFMKNKIHQLKTQKFGDFCIRKTFLFLDRLFFVENYFILSNMIKHNVLSNIKIIQNFWTNIRKQKRFDSSDIEKQFYYIITFWVSTGTENPFQFQVNIGTSR